MSKDKELDAFLQKVDSLASVMSGFKSTDVTEQTEAITKADQMIEAANRKSSDKIGFSRTVINKNMDKEADQPQNDQMNPDTFMKVLEADASERAEKRRQRQKEASAIRLRGNKQFQDGDFEKAYELYTEALGKIKDDKSIYTNRAQALIKLGRYTEALSDCDWALRVDAECVKALVHQGRSHLGLRNYDDARSSYRLALEVDPKKENMIEDYLAEVDRSQSAELAESVAQSRFEAGDNGVKDIGVLLEKVCRPKELPVYYGGGFSIIAELINTDDQRTIFRAKDGLQLHASHTVLKRCLGASPKSLSQEELQMVGSALHMFTAACTDNEKNQEEMLDDHLAPHLLEFLESSIKGHGPELKSTILSLLQTLSVSHIGRAKIISHVDLTRLMVYVLANIRSKSASTKGVAVLNNLALHAKFKTLLRGNFEENILPQFNKLLHDNSALSLPALPLCITMVTNLSCDETMRRKLSDSDELWDCSSQILTLSLADHSKLTQEVSFNLIGLLINISNRPAQPLVKHGPQICTACWDIYEGEDTHESTKDRCSQLLAKLLLHSPQCVGVTYARHAYAHFIADIKDKCASRLVFCVKGLAACTQANDDICKQVVHKQDFLCLVELLNFGDETVVGNAALCLGHCAVIPGMCGQLAASNVIMDLLTLCRDGRKEVMQQNCAILVAKLCQGDTRHLERLRDLHGLEILHLAAKPYRNV